MILGQFDLFVLGVLFDSMGLAKLEDILYVWVSRGLYILP